MNKNNSLWINLITLVKVKVLEIHGIIVTYQFYDKESLKEEYGINYRKYFNKIIKEDLSEFNKIFTEIK